MIISRIDSVEEMGFTTTGYWAEDHKNRENPSLVRLNISRINSEGKSRIYIYHLLGRRPQRGENLSPVKVNISRISSLVNKSRDCNYLFTG
jgi:hypothetical protein